MTLEAFPLPPVVPVGVAARMYRAGAAHALASGFTTIQLDTAQFDTAGGFSPSNNRYIVPVSGYYHVDGNIAVTATTPVESLACIAVNGVERVRGNRFTSYSGATITPDVVVSDVLFLNAGDYVQLWAYMGGAANLQAPGVGSPWVWTAMAIHLITGGAVVTPGSRSAWTNIASNPGFTGTWDDLVGAPWTPCGWQLGVDGLVMLRGLARWNATISPDAQVICTLPPAIRPNTVARLFIARWSGGAQNGWCRIDVESTGAVTPREFVSVGAPTTWQGTWVSLSGCIWSTQ